MKTEVHGRIASVSYSGCSVCEVGLSELCLSRQLHDDKTAAAAKQSKLWKGEGSCTMVQD